MERSTPNSCSLLFKKFPAKGIFWGFFKKCHATDFFHTIDFKVLCLICLKEVYGVRVLITILIFTKCFVTNAAI